MTVNCQSCGKSFQVMDGSPTASLVCPWCQTPIAASPSRSAPAPLSLDAAMQLPPAPVGNANPSTKSLGTRGMVLLFVLSIVAGLGTFVALQYGSGVVPESAWQEYRPADRSFSVLLPGVPSEEPRTEAAAYPIMRDSGQVIVRRRFERVTAWVAWVNLSPDAAKSVRPEDLLAAERQRRAVELHGTATAIGGLKFGEWMGEEVRYDTPSGPAVERIIAVTTGPHPRVYAIGVSGPNVAPDGPVARRVMNSFHVGE